MNVHFISTKTLSAEIILEILRPKLTLYLSLQAYDDAISCLNLKSSLYAISVLPSPRGASLGNLKKATPNSHNLGM